MLLLVTVGRFEIPPELLNEIPPELLDELRAGTSAYSTGPSTSAAAGPSTSASAGPSTAADDTTSNDLLMAQMLQMEFDKEADELLDKEQKHYNKNSKVGLWLYIHVDTTPQQQLKQQEQEQQGRLIVIHRHCSTTAAETARTVR